MLWSSSTYHAYFRKYRRTELSPSFWIMLYCGTCNQIAFLTLYNINSRLVSLLKVFDAPVQVYDICNLIVSFKCINCSSHVFILFFLKCPLVLCLTLLRLSTLLQFGSYNHGILVCCASFDQKNVNILQNHGLWCLKLYTPRLSWDEGSIFSWVFSQALVMSSLSLKISKATNLFEILIWYCFLTSSWFSFLRWGGGSI